LLGLPVDASGIEEDVNESAPLTALCTAIADSIAERLDPLSLRVIPEGRTTRGIIREPGGSQLHTQNSIATAGYQRCSEGSLRRC